jgi:hypothetical protein
MNFKIEILKAKIYLEVLKFIKSSAVSNVLSRGVQKLIRENLKVVRYKFSTLSLAVLVISIIAWHRQAWPHLELKAWHRFRPVSLDLSMA